VSPQERALIDAIRDDPDDDLRRLVYADWLEEQGRPERAELIRVQIELAKRSDAGELADRAVELLQRHKEEWVRPRALCQAVRFVRGMPVLWLEALDDVWAWAERLERMKLPPSVVECRVTVTESSLGNEDVARLVSSPLHPFVTRLDIQSGGGLTIAAAQAIAGAPGSSNLLALSLDRAPIGATGATALASSPHLGRLRRLNLSHSRIGAKGVEAITSSRRLASLQELVLYDGVVEGPSEVIALAQANGLPRLTSLYLTANNIGDARLRLLLSARFLGQLTRLVLAGNAIRDSGARALAACPALSSLRELNLNRNQIGDAGAVALLESPHLRGLRELRLDYNRKITESVRRRLKRRFGSNDDEP